MITIEWITLNISAHGIGADSFIGPCVRARARSDGQGNNGRKHSLFRRSREKFTQWLRLREANSIEFVSLNVYNLYMERDLLHMLFTFLLSIVGYLIFGFFFVGFILIFKF